MITPKPNLVKGQLGNGPLVNEPTWNPTIRDNGSIGNVSTWIMLYWKLYLGLNHLGIRGLPVFVTAFFVEDLPKGMWGEPASWLCKSSAHEEGFKSRKGQRLRSHDFARASAVVVRRRRTRVREWQHRFQELLPFSCNQPTTTTVEGCLLAPTPNRF